MGIHFCVCGGGQKDEEITNRNNMLDTLESKAAEVDIPKGMGAFSLSIVGTNANSRTIMPSFGIK